MKRFKHFLLFVGLFFLAFAAHALTPGTPTISGSHYLCSGTTVLTASSANATSYQWFNGLTPISGATSASYTVTADGDYRVQGFNGGNGSSRVDWPVYGVPVTQNITGPNTVCQGLSITLTAVNSDGSANNNQYTYQWYNGSGVAISGATASTLNVTTGDQYSVQAFDVCGHSNNSSYYTVTLNTPPPTPTISGPTSFCPGNSITLTATANTATSFQWYDNGTVISGQTGSTLSVSAAGSYSVVAFNNCTSPTSSNYVVSVGSAPGTPTIAGASSFCSGSNDVLTATSANATSFQWYDNGTAISGATSATYSATDAGPFTVVGISGCGNSSASSAFSLTINNVPGTPTISGASTVCSGSNDVLTASSNNATSFQWYNNGSPIGGAIGSTYAATAAGNYTVVGVDGCGSSSVSPTFGVTLSTVPSGYYITGPSNVCGGSSITLTCNAGSGNATGYQWYNNGSILSGQTASTLNVSSAGSYTVTASDACGTSAASSAYVVSGSAVPGTPTITGATTVCSGSTIVLTASSANANSYLWYNNGGLLAGETFATLNVTAAGNYTVIGVDACGNSVASAAHVVTVSTVPTVPTVSGPATVCSGSTITLTAASSANAVSYQWYNGGTIISGQTSSTLSVTAAGSYTVTATDACGTSAASAAFAVTLSNVPGTPTIAGASSFCSGSNDVLTATSANATSYQWYNGGTAIGGATSATYTATAAGSYTVVGVDACGNSATSAAFAVTMNNVPGTPTIAGASSFCSGSNDVLTATSANATSYQWYNGGTAIGGATSATYTATAAGSYTVTATDACGTSAASSVFTVTTSTTPTGIVISGSNTFCAGSSTTLSLSGSGATSFYWELNGSLINGSSGQFTIAATQAGTYNVVATNSCGNTTSPNFVLTANNVPGTPTIAGASSFCSGSNDVLTATSANATSYQWYNGGTAIGGATAATYTATAAGSYTVVGVDACGNSATSAASVVTMNNVPGTPTIAGATTVCSGSTDNLTATSANAVSYQWYNGGTAIGGATSATYGATTAGSYTVKGVDACGSSVASTAFTVTLTNVPGTPTIAGASSFCSGSNDVLTATSANATSYQWYNGGTAIGGATSATCTATAAGSYTVVGVDACGNSAASAAFAVTMNNVPGTPTIAGATTVCSGSTDNLTATSANAVSYQWYNGGTAIGGATSATYGATTAGSYTVKGVDACGSSVASTAFTVTLTTIPTVPTVSGPATVCSGSTITLTAASSANAVSYQWYNGGTIISGQTSSTLSVTAAGSYTVTATDACGTSAASAAFAVTLSNVPGTPTIAGASSFCSGSNDVLTATSANATSYQWYLGGTAIGGATSATYTATAAGSYTVVGVDACGNSAASAALVVTTTSVPPAPTIAGASSFCSGSNDVLTATSSGATSYQWYLGGTVISGATSATYTATATGSYTVTATATCGTSPASAAFVVTMNNVPGTPTIAGATTVCSGSTIVLTASSANAVSYQWSNGGTAIGGATLATLNVTAAGNYTVIGVDACGNSVASAAHVVTVSTVPTVPTVSGPATVCSGSTITLTAASSANAVSYQWYNGGTIISGQTSSTLSVTAAGSYTVTATDACGTSAASAAFAVTLSNVPGTPTIAGASSFCSGSNDVLTATSANATSYQWYNGGTAIGGATSATYTATAAGSYTVVGVDACGNSATSAASVVTMNNVPGTPTIAGATTVCSGSTDNLTATSANAVSYQWYNGGTAIGGATSATYGATTAGSYTVKGVDACGSSVASTAFTVTLTNVPGTPTIAGASSFCSGSNDVLTATSANATSYQWYNGGTAIGGATSATYTATAAGSYTVVGVDACGNSAASAALVVTTTSVPPAPTIAGASSFCSGSNDVLTATASGATSYQWYNGGTAIGGATSATYTATAAGSYTVTATATCGTSPASAAFVVTMNNVPGTPTIAGATTVCSGSTDNLTATSANAVSYQWYNGGTAIGGATAATYGATTAGSYTVKGVDACGSSVASTAFTVTLTTIPTVPTVSGPATVCSGSTITLTAASSANAVSYQWYNGGTIISGQTSSTLSVTAAGSYTVTATDACGTSAASAAFAVTLSNVPGTPTIAGASSFCSGSNAVLTATSANATSYQWYLGGTAISGATSATYTATAAGSYTVVGVDACGNSATSAASVVTMNNVPGTPTIAGASSFCSGSNDVLTATSANATSYQWYNGGTAIGGATSATYTATAAGSYTVIGIDACGNSATSTAFAVTMNNVPGTPTIAGATTVCSGSTDNLTATSANAVSYQWYNGGTAIGGATAATYGATTAGSYTVKGVDACGSSVASTSFTVTLTTIPTVPTVSGPTAVCSGSTITLTAASSANATSYQWLNGGTVIAGQTSSTLSVTAAGSYTVTATDACGTSAASSAYVVGGSAVPGTPTITGASTVCSGSTITLTASATNAVSYLWYNNGTVIAGATSATLSVTAAGNYTAEGVDACGNSSASSAHAVILSTIPSGYFITGPSTVCSGSTITLTNNAGSGGTSGYWTLNGTTIAGSAGSGSISVTQAGTYNTVINSACGSFTSPNFVVSLSTIPTVPTVSGSTAVCSGSTITLTAASSANATSFQWLNGGTVIAGATSATLSVTAAGSYTVTATDACGTSAASSAYVVGGSAVPGTPTITGASTVCSGSTITLTASATNAVSYLWYNNGTVIAGATSATLSVTAAGNYTAEGVDACGNSSASSAHVVTLNDVPGTPIISGSSTICHGAYSSLTATASGAISYLWYEGGTLISGQTGSTITISTAGSYTAIGVDACGNSATSTSFDVTSVNVTPMPIISGPVTVCNGSSITLTSSNTGAISYQWSNNGTVISGATSATLSVSTAGSYTVVGINGCGNSVTSPAHVVTLGDVPGTPTITGASTVCSGSTLTLTASATNAVSYLWYNNGTVISGQTAATLSVTAAGNYTAVGVDACGNSVTSSAHAVTLSTIPTTPTVSGPTAVCSGSTITLTAASSANATSYQWLNGGTVIAGQTSSTLSVTAAGSYTVTATDACGTSAASSAYVVSGSAVPGTPTITGASSSGTPIVSGQDTVCSGGAITLTATSTNAVSYQWYLAGNLINPISTPIDGATGSTYVYAPNGVNAHSAVFSVVGIDACGNSAISPSFVVWKDVVPDRPTINGANSVCFGSIDVLTASATNAVSYLWYNGGTLISGQTAATLDVTTAGTYTVVGVDPCGNSVSSATFPVSVETPPTPTITVN